MLARAQKAADYVDATILLFLALCGTVTVELRLGSHPARALATHETSSLLPAQMI
jgi:hypothetical protein